MIAARDFPATLLGEKPFPLLTVIAAASAASFAAYTAIFILFAASNVRSDATTAAFRCAARNFATWTAPSANCSHTSTASWESGCETYRQIWRQQPQANNRLFRSDVLSLTNLSISSTSAQVSHSASV